MTMAVATISLAGSDRLVQDPAALRSEPIPWRSPDLSPTNLATLLAARLGERARADDAERVLRELGATVDRSDDTLYATAPAGARWSLGASPRWSITGAIEVASGQLVRLEVRYLSGK
jgi:hypothetical protein